ncbi:Endosome protein [Mycena venus]|uniref:Endosome protein n=1 Tax=Mycena venus TaxID=2733690 RepID=A0A8H7D7W0_9AGAR|nr:Endosome protein [Mycena venus]
MTLISVELDKRSFWSRRLNHRLVLEKPPSVDNRAAHFKNRGDACLTSNLPIIAGHYNSATKRGVYFEITIRQMEGNAIIALGMQCLPYPPNRLPGWHRKSAALHFDDRRIYFDDSEGGIDYMRDVYNPQLGTSIKQHNVPEIKAMDIVGCGYEFPLNVGGVGSLFYTYNGERLPAAFPAIFDPKEEGQEFDVFAAVGFTDGPCQFDVNFGLTTFKWSDANSYLREWTVEGLFRQLGDGPPQYGS